MKTKAKRPSPAMVMKDGQPTAVILDLRTYEEMLERLDEIDDLAALREMRKKPLKFRDLDAFLSEIHRRA